MTTTSPHAGPTPLFRFGQGQTNSVRVENISKHTSIGEVVALFNTLIGDVKSSQDRKDNTGDFLEITFFNQDAAMKSLCMNGYMVHGMSLYVNRPLQSHICAYMDEDFSLPKPRPKHQQDDRRNLYVLGLPFALTKTEFMTIFSRFGTVSHCVILATVDNSSRRRGFVVMSSHDEAKLAMSSLTRSQVKGHTLDISWAVVQRSQGKFSLLFLTLLIYLLYTGFLDGGDRTLAVDSRVSQGYCPPDILLETPIPPSANSSSSSITSHENDPASLSPSPVATPTLLVTNLSSLLFSQLQDMHPLFYPFGRIKKLEIVDTSPGSTSAVVEYASAEIAQEAKETLHGQCYAGHQISARYVRTKSSILDLDAAFYHTNAPRTFVPFARQPPFLLGPTGSGSYRDSMHLQCFSNGSRYTPNGPQHAHLYATHPAFSFDYRQRNLSRSKPAISR
ncbi:hypothetical protein BDZ94DRAFT_1305069 [Collybia nuda]|uniref:RRM domain-containing protein n=1 Tax=Collybia nuda TaxID=64659 RepID=A0A9P5YG04_9AGAR|nr:hypothetical protein BDZ94DRAFT_1305069 [Collybia nuda]